jgi:Rrf2 family protein
VSVLSAGGERIDAKTISERASVTLRFALKILRKLVTAGIVKSYKGTQGGYRLNKEPSEITLRDVIEATEGTYYFSRCLSDEHVCNRGMEEVCCYRKAFGEITENVRRQLESYNFADMIAASQESREREDEQQQTEFQSE